MYVGDVDITAGVSTFEINVLNHRLIKQIEVVLTPTEVLDLKMVCVFLKKLKKKSVLKL